MWYQSSKLINLILFYKPYSIFIAEIRNRKRDQPSLLAITTLPLSNTNQPSPPQANIVASHLHQDQPSSSDPAPQSHPSHDRPQSCSLPIHGQPNHGHSQSHSSPRCATRPPLSSATPICIYLGAAVSPTTTKTVASFDSIVQPHLLLPGMKAGFGCWWPPAAVAGNQAKVASYEGRYHLFRAFLISTMKTEYDV